MGTIPELTPPLVVQNAPGYNSWPFVQVLGNKLVCAYSRGERHSIAERCRGVYARTSRNDGRTWTPETLVVNTAEFGESAIGKGLDADGAMLLWVRCVGDSCRHDLYRSTDGANFARIASLQPDPMPMQITDVFNVPGVGLMAFWFAGRYRDLPENSWGTLASADNGVSWKQTVVEAGLEKGDWPTEPSGVYLGDGRIIAIARVEKTGDAAGHGQFQLESADGGATWKKRRTNIGDVRESTPCLLWDADSGRLSNYYFQRGQGVLKRRVASPPQVWGTPLAWPAPEIVSAGSKKDYHAGNVNATALGKTHFCAFYSGNEIQTEVVIASVPSPRG